MESERETVRIVVDQEFAHMANTKTDARIASAQKVVTSTIY